MAETENYTYRLYEKKDKPGVEALLKTVWGENIAKRNLELWDWKIHDNPNNPAEGPRSYLAFCEDKIIAVMATIPMAFKFRDKIRTFLWVVDYAADPAYKTVGWRIFLRLRKEPYVLVGTPNYASYTIAIAIKWFEIRDFYNYFKVVRAGQLLAAKNKFKALAPLAGLAWTIVSAGLKLFNRPVRDKNTVIEEVFAFGKEFDELWDAVSGGYEAIAVRNAQILKWKYLDLPGKKFRIFLARKNNRPTGYIITSIGEESGYQKGEIADFLTAVDDEKTLSLLFQKAVQELESGGVDMISSFMIDGHPGPIKVLRKNGFLFKKKRFPVIAYQTKQADVPKAEMIDATWFVNSGDSDLIVY